MGNTVSSQREFVRGAARRKDLVYMITKGKALLDQGIAHSGIIGIYQGGWVDGTNTTWDASAIAVARRPSEKIVVIGEDGDVATYVGGQTTSESVRPEPALIRNASTVDGLVVACGMRRQVYHRVGENTWIDASAPAPGEGEEAGFEAIDGYSLQEMYAVGWGGEIWQYDGKSWTDRASPTNVILAAVCCGGDDMVYAGGQQGVLVRGRHDSWDLIVWDDDVDTDIWDLCWFADTLYVATDTGLYTLNDGHLDRVDLGEIAASSFFSLTTAEGVLWSIGHEDVLSFDGNTWQRYD
jgi:hypothetical protein